MWPVRCGLHHTQTDTGWTSPCSPPSLLPGNPPDGRLARPHQLHTPPCKIHSYELENFLSISMVKHWASYSYTCRNVSLTSFIAVTLWKYCPCQCVSVSIWVSLMRNWSDLLFTLSYSLLFHSGKLFVVFRRLHAPGLKSNKYCKNIQFPSFQWFIQLMRKGLQLFHKAESDLP